ncbi:MAG: hypothetical protein MUQ27_06715, partial [Acidimicrobiia bacterium]|nr:hypothetical protein [Acidimicrobiia bacterium]
FSWELVEYDPTVITPLVNASGDGCLLSPTKAVTCDVRGPFEVWHYYPIAQIGVTDFDFTLIITPRTKT